jgi:hypothetical protein
MEPKISEKDMESRIREENSSAMGRRKNL